MDTGEVIRMFRPPFLLSRFAIQDLLVKLEIFFFNDCHLMKEVLVGIPFERAKYYSYSLAIQKEHTCAIDRRIPLQTKAEYENTYLSQLNGLHTIEKQKGQNEVTSEHVEEGTVAKRKKILTPRIQAMVAPSSPSVTEAQQTMDFPSPAYFRRESKNISSSDLDSMLRILFPAIFPLWGRSCKVGPYYYYSIAGSSEEFYDTWSMYKRKTVLFIWSKNISLAAKIYWRLRSPIPISQIIAWSTNPAILLLEIPPYAYADKVISMLGCSQNSSPVFSKSALRHSHLVSNRDHWKEMILALQGGQHPTDQALYCRYCGKPFLLDQMPGSNLASHYKRCVLKPLRNELSTILQMEPLNLRLNFSKELWMDVEFRRFWLRQNSTISPPISKELIDIWWIFDNLPKRPQQTLSRFGLLEKKDFIPIGISISKVSAYDSIHSFLP